MRAHHSLSVGFNAGHIKANNLKITLPRKENEMKKLKAVTLNGKSQKNELVEKSAVQMGRGMCRHNHMSRGC